MAPSGRDIADWLVGEGRLLGDGIAIAEGLAERLIEAGVPLLRLRIAQRLSNPLLAAWGVIWRRDLGRSEDYVVPTQLLETSTWIGSPFQQVVQSRASLRKRLTSLHPDDNGVFHEMAEIGGTDFYAMPLEFGDGSVQGMSFVAEGEHGFSEGQIHLFESLRHPLAAATEAVAMRRSKASLLKTYLGKGPSEAVTAGSIRRGDLSTVNAVVMFSDLRGFTDKSSRWSDRELLDALDGYFEAVVDAVHRHQGDVLKFLGDGILAVFPIKDEGSTKARCAGALEAAFDARQGLAQFNDTREAAGQEPIDFGTALHVGEVTYGNIGSPDRLDFTVIGETVNLASRLEGLCKTLDEPILCSDAMGECLASKLHSIGSHEIHGLAHPVWISVPTGAISI
ncbi:MAG: adenylate/guanylate cyclase domain-containing protein [Geminicoccaceae bacterium]